MHVFTQNVKTEIDLNSGSLLSDRINWLIDAGIEAEAKRETARNYLGCSLLGAECERAIQIDAFMTLYPERCDNATTVFPARVRRVFQRGHDAEDRAASWLRSAGFLLMTNDALHGGQIEVVFKDGRVRGHADGLIPHFLGKGSSPFPLPALWECKCLGSKYWRAASRDGIAISHPQYVAQVQLYMGGLGLERCLFTLVNADTCELQHEIINFDSSAFDWLLVKAGRILSACDAGEMLPRISTSEADVRCRMCRHAAACWGKP